ncbi:MAG: transglutaminase family protein [Cytophagaceae bacterium]|nr:transglutaminase family protein [Cytophagaceae bacterium]MDW8456991.1 transglutaminase family protein [Cytophagaceae bacterium]
MPQYKVKYSTRNTYAEQVKEGVYELNVCPCTDDSQLLKSYTVKHSLAEQPFVYKNIFGFEIMRVRSVSPFNEFNFDFEALVQKENSKPVTSSDLSADEENEIINSKEFYIDHHLFVTPSHYTRIDESQIRDAPSLSKGMRVFDFLMEVNAYVNRLLSYHKNITNVYTSAGEAISLGKGVCQDYAHVFIAIARHNKVPCRYVSGYINQSKHFVGDSFMHAWVEAFVPGSGWIGLDPTNLMLADDNFIKVSHGVDYADCTPIKGVLHTNGQQKTSARVSVSQQ